MITFAIFTCNRLFYLKNCVSSILDFVDLNDIDLLIVDNNTTEKGIHSYLSSLPSFIKIKTYNKRHPNELHRSMNYAIKYTQKKGNKFVNFIQDDYQYLSSTPCLSQKICDAFKKRLDVIQLQTNFAWKYKAKKIGKVSQVVVSGTKWHYLHNKSPCDNGITRVSIYDKTGLYPKKVSVHGREKKYRSGEAWFANKTSNYKRMLLAEPNLAMIVDCAFIRGKERIGRYFPPLGKYYLKPLDDDTKEQIRKMAKKNSICFIEDFIKPDGWTPDAMQKHNNRKIKSKL